MNGPTATQRIRADNSSIQVIALSSFIEEDLVQKAIKSGAIGYLLKDVHSDNLARAIRDAHSGRATIDSSVAQLLVKTARQPLPLGHDLTDREREILVLIVAGKTNKEIAEQFTLSVGTVRFHVSNILSKLGASNRTEAASLAFHHKIV